METQKPQILKFDFSSDIEFLATIPLKAKYFVQKTRKLEKRLMGVMEIKVGWVKTRINSVNNMQ